MSARSFEEALDGVSGVSATPVPEEAEEELLLE